MNIFHKIIFLKEEPSNIYIQAEFSGFCGVFRIVYERKRDNKLATDVYFETKLLPEGHFSNTYNVEGMVDACLFMERKKQWMIEEAISQQKKLFV